MGIGLPISVTHSITKAFTPRYPYIIPQSLKCTDGIEVMPMVDITQDYMRTSSLWLNSQLGYHYVVHPQRMLIAALNEAKRVYS